jgi:hypothetical protein
MPHVWQVWRHPPHVTGTPVSTLYPVTCGQVRKVSLCCCMWELYGPEVLEFIRVFTDGLGTVRLYVVGQVRGRKAACYVCALQVRAAVNRHNTRLTQILTLMLQCV